MKKFKLILNKKMADILDLNTEEEFEGVEADREVRMKDDDEEEEESVSRLKEKVRKRKGRGFGGGRRGGDSDADGDYDRLVSVVDVAVLLDDDETYEAVMTQSIKTLKHILRSNCVNFLKT